MIFPTIELQKRFLAEFGPGHSAEEKVEDGRRMAAVDPWRGEGWALQCISLLQLGKPEEAEAVCWKALEFLPVSGPTFLDAMEVVQRRGGPMDLALGLTELAVHHFTALDSVSPGLQEAVGDLLEHAGGNRQDPAAFIALRELLRSRMDGESPRVKARLEPYRVLAALTPETHGFPGPGALEAVRADPSRYAPLLMSALRQWGRTFIVADSLAAPGCVYAALLGEAGGPDCIAELLALLDCADLDVRMHFNWAVWRLGARFPGQAAAAIDSLLPPRALTQAAIFAEQLQHLPGGVALPVLRRLAADGDRFAGEDSDGILPVLLESGFRAHGADGAAEAAALRARTTPVENFLPLFEQGGLTEIAIEDILERRALFGSPEEKGPVRPGRNEPCWCGSGKKYKRCHLASDEEGVPEPDSSTMGRDGEIGRLRNDPMVKRITGEIIRFSTESYLDVRTQRRAVGSYFEAAGGLPEPDRQAELMPWLIYDFRPSPGKRTAAEGFVHRNRSRLSEEEAAVADALAKSEFGLFECLSVREDAGVELGNMITRDTVFVHDRSMSRDIVVWDALFARIARLPRWNEFAGDGFPVSRDRVDALLESISAEASRAGVPDATWLRTNAPAAARLNSAKGRPSRAPKLVNYDGDPLEFVSATFDLIDETAVREALERGRDIEKGGAANSLSWLTPEDGPANQAGGRTVLGGIFFEDGRLRLDCNSRKRIERGKRMLAELAGGWLRPLGETVKSIEDAMRESKEQGAPPPQAIDPELADKIVREHQARHYAEWPDTPLPALDGRTPRQSAKSKTGRAQLEKLLREMEWREARAVKSGKPAFDFGILRKKLGM